MQYIVTFLNNEGNSDWKEVNDEYIAQEGETLHEIEDNEGILGSTAENFIVVPNPDPTQLPSVQILD